MYYYLIREFFSTYKIPISNYIKIQVLGNQVKDQMKDHVKDNSALSEHTYETNHTIAWDNSKIITTNRRYHQRRCLEAWHINSAHASLNRDDGGLLPDAYLYLINR